MEHDIWHYQIQYMQRLQKLQDVLKKRKPQSEEPLQVFQNSMIQVGAKFWNNVWQNPNHIMDAHKRFFETLNSPADKVHSSYAKYFKSDLWDSAPYFQWIRDIYIKTAEWAIETTEEESLGFSGEEKDKLMFMTRQWIESLNPRNFPATNPEIWRETIETKGENFLKGIDNLIGDIERGAMSMTDQTAFQVGKNIATTKGSVIFKNKMMELIQYAPTTDKVNKTPVVIIPPWINKYYILDLTPETSMIQWMVNQGHTVFCISWANPDESFREIEFKDYMHDGALKAIEVANDICGTDSAHAVGYCIGGTLLAMTQAWLAGHKKSKTPNPIATATFITTLLDFESAGDLKIFIDKDQVQTIKKIITDRGVMDGKAMAMTFSLLRASDLIWSFVINNYMMGRTPMPFDLLYWNGDSTNLPAAMHGDYLQSFYLNNDLTKGDYILDDIQLDLTKITTPAYFISTRDDHIAPWMATQSGANLYGKGKNVTFVLGGSGHVAGVVNPPAKNKYGFEVMTDDNNTRHDGSWWTHWQKWTEKLNNHETISARKALGNASYKIIDAAPGKYVLQKT
jgi:polyhydroxyalkanoate synthase subunit PhaC